MTAETTVVRGAVPAPGADYDIGRLRGAVTQHWPLFLGMVLVLVPTLIRIAQQTWSTEAGAHGPIVLATGLWLLSYDRPRDTGEVRRASGFVPRLAWLAPALFAWAAYIFGRAYDFISLEALGCYLLALVAAWLVIGGAALRRSLFPFFYLGFVIPPPGWVIDRLTAPLQTFISWSAVHLLQALDYPVARQGVALTIAQYQLLVEDACAGMNSLTGLTAVSLFYIYVMHRASWRYALLLVAMIIPIAVFVNLIRVIALILITYYYGDAAAQGFLHVTTGLVLFALAIASIFALDAVLRPLWNAAGRRRAAA